MSGNNPSQSILLTERLKQIAEEQSVGGHFDGESKRERSVGHSREVVVDIFMRNANLDELGKAGSYFMRVSLRSMIDPTIISRFEIDIAKHSSRSELMKQALIGGAAVAIADIENRGARWDPDYVAHQAEQAMDELLKEIDSQ